MNSNQSSRRTVLEGRWNVLQLHKLPVSAVLLSNRYKSPLLCTYRVEHIVFKSIKSFPAACIYQQDRIWWTNGDTDIIHHLAAPGAADPWGHPRHRSLGLEDTSVTFCIIPSQGPACGNDWVCVRVSETGTSWTCIYCFLNFIWFI